MCFYCSNNSEEFRSYWKWTDVIELGRVKHGGHERGELDMDWSWRARIWRRKILRRAVQIQRPHGGDYSSCWQKHQYQPQRWASPYQSPNYLFNCCISPSSTRFHEVAHVARCEMFCLGCLFPISLISPCSIPADCRHASDGHRADTEVPGGALGWRAPISSRSGTPSARKSERQDGCESLYCVSLGVRNPNGAR